MEVKICYYICTKYFLPVKLVVHMCNDELLKLIEKPWLSVDDIMKICECGSSSARRIAKFIEDQVISSGKNLPPSKKKLVPTNLVLDYLNIDVEYLRKAQKFKEEKAYVS